MPILEIVTSAVLKERIGAQRRTKVQTVTVHDASTVAGVVGEKVHLWMKRR